MAVLERIISFIMVTLCYLAYQRSGTDDRDESVAQLYKLFAIGIFLYGSTMWAVLFSSRFIYIFKVVEIALLCHCIPKCGKIWKVKIGKVVFLYCLALSTIMYMKNIDSYLEQGQYQNATVWNYPYVSVFNQKDILNYLFSIRIQSHCNFRVWDMWRQKGRWQ